MISLIRHSIRRQLTLLVFLAMALVLFVTGVIVAWWEWSFELEKARRDLHTMARLIAGQSTAIMGFHDEEAAQELLAALAETGKVVSADLILADGVLLARYRRPGDSAQNLDDLIVIREEVSLGHRTLGWAVVRGVEEEMEEEVWREITPLLAIPPLVMILSWLLARWLQGMISRRVVTLNQAMLQVSREKDYSVRIPHQGEDELGELGRGFNLMLEEIERRDRALGDQQRRLEEGIRQRTQELDQELQQHKETARRLAQAKEAAESANQAKDRFLATISHEIRTPMNGVMGMADLLLATPLDDRQRHFADTIRRSGRILLRVINDILDLSKIQAGRLSLEIIGFDLADVMDEVRDLFQELAANKGLVFTCRVAEGVPTTLFGDPFRLNQVLFNLVGNAIKFTQQGGVEVTVTLLEETAADAQLRFSVRDTGIGVPTHDQSMLFTPFFQAGQTTNRRHGGTGLGLVIVKHLVTLMNGEVKYTSREGEGTEFWITCRFGKQLPWYREHLHRRQARDQRGQPRFHAHILLVEDNPVNQEVAQESLRLRGCRVAVAAHGQEALELLRRNRFDIVLMDCEMPVMDGYQATREIRRLQGAGVLPDFPVIALTAHVMDSTRRACEEAGMVGCLHKPFSQRALAELLEKWLPTEEGGAASPVAEEVLELSHLDELRQMEQAGAAGLVARMARHYLEQMPAWLATLRQGLEQGDGERVRGAAHTMKSSSATLGATALAQLCAELEAVHADTEESARLLEQVEAALPQVTAAIAVLGQEE